jgi:hypothetical protein
MNEIISIDDMVFPLHKSWPIYADKRNKVEIVVENAILDRVESYLRKHNMIQIEIGEKIRITASDVGLQKVCYNEKSTILAIVFNVY